MKTKRDLIKTISIVRGNLSHIESTGNINGTLLIEIERVMEEYAQQQVKNLNIPAVKGSALFDAMGKFAVEKFPDAGSIEHLKKLKHEADEAIAEPQNLVEYADILLALFGAAYKAGFTYEQLLEASVGKFEIVQKRTWIRLDDGTYQHCP